MRHLDRRLLISQGEKLRSRWLSSRKIIERDERLGGHHFKSLPVVLRRAEGVYCWDTEGKRYIDLLAGFATVSQGHSHPRLVEAMRDQVAKLAHTSRAFYTEPHGELAEYLTAITGYERFLPMNTGVEAGDTALKIARRWGYRTKKIPSNKATTIFAKGNYWGRSLAALSASTDPNCYRDFGPYMPLFDSVTFDDLEALERKLQENPNVCAFMVEPIQGEAGVVIPSNGYLRGVRELCTKYNVLLVVDEVQTGLGRTGRRLAVDHEAVKPDLLVVGKALSGGMYPVSGVLGSSEMILALETGVHGSTFGGSPLGQRVALEALKILEEEKLAENAAKMGEIVRKELEKIPKDIALEFRGRGLLAGLQLNPDFANGWDICAKLINKGLLTRPAHNYIIRISPPLVINEEQIRVALNIITSTLLSHRKT
ncbi:PREDICTED: ornithine aminotransferase, mitochondrial-like [Ceratosolen solmsi marchali]|uniref:Ornithine aminotransferase n=1 Tax=Ceratosolen solmsi marchali TaxID=326594 RepID=A0AAJ6YG23_9HYME|nr:PREDICTED: ornithine aminotransferase, mitochondrial-like [Ceratosolen solmsi marchali]